MQSLIMVIQCGEKYGKIKFLLNMYRPEVSVKMQIFL